MCDVALREGWERSLAYFLIAKNKFINISVYRFSYRKLGDVLGISHECARYHYKVWEQQGLVKVHGKRNSLTFLGMEAMSKIADRNRDREVSCRNKINLNLHDNIGDMISCIRARAIMKNINQQIKITSKVSEAVKVVQSSKTEGNIKGGVKAYKKALRVLEDYKKPVKSYNGAIMLSDEGISRLLGCSLSHAKKLKVFIRENGLLYPRKVLGAKLIPNKLPKHIYLKVKSFGEYSDTFWHKGYVYSYPKTVWERGMSAKPFTQLLNH